MNFGDCPYEGCTGSLWELLPEGVSLPQYSRTTCETCGQDVWYRHSRVDPKAWTVADFEATHIVDDAARVVRERQQDAIEAHLPVNVFWTHESEPRPAYDPVITLPMENIEALRVRAECSHCGTVLGDSACVVSAGGYMEPRVTIGALCACGSTTVRVMGYPACGSCLLSLDKCACDDGTGRHPTNPPEITEA